VPLTWPGLGSEPSAATPQCGRQVHPTSKQRGYSLRSSSIQPAPGFDSKVPSWKSRRPIFENSTVAENAGAIRLSERRRAQTPRCIRFYSLITDHPLLYTEPRTSPDRMGLLSHLFFPWGIILQALAILHFIRASRHYWFFVITSSAPSAPSSTSLIEAASRPQLSQPPVRPRFSRRKRIRELEALVQVNTAVGNFEELGDL